MSEEKWGKWQQTRVVLSFWPTGRDWGYEGKVCVPKLGLLFLALCSKICFSPEKNVSGFGWGGLVWPGGGAGWQSCTRNSHSGGGAGGLQLPPSAADKHIPAGHGLSRAVGGLTKVWADQRGGLWRHWLHRDAVFCFATTCGAIRWAREHVHPFEGVHDMPLEGIKDKETPPFP